MLKMYLDDIKYESNKLPSMLVFTDAKDGGRMLIEISETICFDLFVLFNQKKSGATPYLGICEVIRQTGANINKLMIKESQNPGTALMLLEISGKITEVELFFADIVSVAIVLGLPIYFDESVCLKKEFSLSDRLLWTRTQDITNYSFDTNS